MQPVTEPKRPSEYAWLNGLLAVAVIAAGVAIKLLFFG
jgi:hypothetical protein